ncbi:MAG TPA: hypothetical protein VH643_21355 [Gemmataceae bacterium]|jgi:hypothetical protein
MLRSDKKLWQPDDDGRLWRYMDFTKFVSMLDTKALFFSRLDKLEDKYEGTLSKPTLAWVERSLGSQPTEQKAKWSQTLEVYKSFKAHMFVNCWHINEHESTAMWDLYLKSDEGVAVRSTFKRIKDSLSSCPYSIDASKVRYVDYETELIPVGGDTSIYYPVVHKRKSYQHENELRLFCWGYNLSIEDQKVAGLDLAGPIYPCLLPQLPDRPGVSLGVNLDALIEEVYVAPSCPGWFLDLVNSVLSKYEVAREARKSNLDSDPLW